MNHDDGDIITMRNVGIPFDHNRTVVSRLPFLAPLQMVYELNNAVALFSGEAQRDFFTALCGDPSPSERAVMPLDDLTLRIAEEVAVSHAAFRQNSSDRFAAAFLNEVRTTLNDLLDGFAVIAMRSSRCVQPTLHAVGDAVVGMVKTASVRHARMSKRSDSALDRERRSVRAAWTDKQAEIALCISFEHLTEMHALEAFINAEIMPMIDRDRIALIDMTARRVVIAALERARIDKGGARGAESTVCILRQRSVLPAGEVRFEDLPSADPDQKAAIDYDAPDDMVVLPSRSGTVAIAITGATALIKTADGDARMIDVARVAPQATTLDVSAVIWRNVHRLRDRLTCLDDQAQRRSRSR